MADENHLPKDGAATGEGREDSGELDLDPYRRPSDMPPAEDPDPAELGALVGAPPRASRTVGGPDRDDARLDLATLARAAAADAASAAPVARQPAGESHDALADRELYVPRSGPPGWLLGLLAGIGLGFGAGALVFRAGPESALAVAAPTAAAATPPPTPSAIAPAGAAVVAAPPPPAPAPPPPVEPAAPPAAPAVPAPVSPAAAAPAVSAPAVPAPAVHSSRSAAPSPAPTRAARAPLAPVPADDTADGPIPTLLRTDAPEAPAQGGGERSMDNLLDDALSPEARREEEERTRAAATRTQVPLTPSREQVEETMAVLRPAIRGCAMGQAGLATADIVVRNDGSVAGVQLTGAPFAGTPSGRCMEGVVRRAKFPRFQKSTFHVRFPFAIQ